MATNYDLGKVMMTYKGTWVSTGTYDILDVCYYEGSSYVSLIPNNTSNIYDTTAWGIIAQRGGIEVAGGTLDTAIAQAMGAQLQPITQSISGLQQDNTGLHNSVTEINQALSNQQSQITTNQAGNQTQFNALGTQLTTNASNISGLSQTSQAQQQVLNDVSAHAIRTNPSVIISTPVDFNTYTTLGQYLINTSSQTNGPIKNGSVGWGQLLVFNVTQYTVGQLLIPDDGTTYEGGTWYRSYNISSSTWNAWGHNVRTDSQGNLSVNDINLGSSGTLASTPAWSSVSGKPDSTKYPIVTDLSSNLIPENNTWTLSNAAILENRISQARGYLEIHFSAACTSSQNSNTEWEVAILSGISGNISGVDDVSDAYGTAVSGVYVGNAYLSKHGNGSLAISCVFDNTIDANTTRAFNMRIPLTY